LRIQAKPHLRESGDKILQQVVDAWELNALLKRPLNQLSQGNLQKVMIAQAFLGDPSYIILDEPSQALDPIEQQRLKQQLKLLGDNQLLIFSSHHINEIVEVADQVILLHRGELVASLDIQSNDEYWLVTSLNLEEIKSINAQVNIEIICHKKNNLIKLADVNNEQWSTLQQQLKQKDDHLVTLGKAGDAMMPLFSLLVNESL
jgi:ABC-type multidrug transport system ATPase subunit